MSLEQVVLFSTPTGDAWILDPADGLARCLCRGGAPRPSGIHETPQTFAVEWELRYELDGDAMVFTDPVGRQRVVVGYPVKDVRQVSRRGRRG